MSLGHVHPLVFREIPNQEAKELSVCVGKEILLTGGGDKNKGFIRALAEQMGQEILVPPEPLITGALGAALLGRELYEKALPKNQPLQTKPRILQGVPMV